MRPGDATWQLDHQYRQHPGTDQRRIASGRYTASKAGVIGLTRDLAQQWTGRKGIRVNAIAPGYFASEMTNQFERDWIEQAVLPRTVQGRLGKPGELDGALIFLASDASSYVTGVRRGAPPRRMLTPRQREDLLQVSHNWARAVATAPIPTR